MMNKIFLITLFLFSFFVLFGCTGSDTFIIQNTKLNKLFDGNVSGDAGLIPFLNLDGNALEVSSGFDFNSDTNTLSTNCLELGDGNTYCSSTDFPNPDLSYYVPYTGATQNLIMSDKNVSADYFFGDGSQLINLPIPDVNIDTSNIVPYVGAVQDLNLGFNSLIDGRLIITDRGISSPSVAPVATRLTGGTLTISRMYYYVYTFVDSDGRETSFSPISNSQTTTSTYRQINLTNIQVSDSPNIVARNIYRNYKTGTINSFIKIDTINDNVTTTYLDNVASDVGQWFLKRKLKEDAISGASFFVGGKLFNIGKNYVVADQSLVANNFFMDEKANTYIMTTAPPNLDWSNTNKGTNNFFVGVDVGRNLVNGYDNVIIGTGTTGVGITNAYGSVIIGKDAGQKLKDGYYNIAIGYRTFGVNGTTISGFNNNVAIGSFSMGGITSHPYNNTAVGVSSLMGLTTGYNNVALGEEAGYKNVLGGAVANARNSIYIGYNSRGGSEAINNNQIVIGASALGKGDNTIVLGNDDVVATYFKGEVFVGKDALRSLVDDGTDLVVEGGALKSVNGFKSSDGSSGITNTTNYWLCKDASCNTTCQVQIKNGLIVGCE